MFLVLARLHGCRNDRAPAVLVGQLGNRGNLASLLGWHNTTCIRLECIEIRLDFHCVGVNVLDPAMHRGRVPLNHARIVLFPTFLEQPLLGELLLRIKNDDLRRWVLLLQHMRDH